MKRETGLLVFLLLFGASVLAQPGPTITLAGRVTDAATHQPLPFATVYLNATTRGTTTDEQGRFRLAGVPLGTVEVVVSSVGYTLVRRVLRLEIDSPPMVEISLTADATLLAAVTVKAAHDHIWKRQYRQFERELLGTSLGRCTILNGTNVRFTTANGHFSATAPEPLLIDNQALGYQVRYELQYFDSFRDTTYYGGTLRFDTLVAPNPKQARQWQQNRLQAYYGSFRHLLASLAANTHEQAGFLVYRADDRVPVAGSPAQLFLSLGGSLKPFDATTAITPGSLAAERWLNSDLPLTVFYTRIAGHSPYLDASYAYSWLRLPQGKIGITTNGLVSVSKGYNVRGYLGNDRLANALPNDWQPSDGPATTNPAHDSPRLPADTLLTALVNRWRLAHRNPAPAVFVQIDKPLYLTGDMVWASAYLLDNQTNRVDESAAEAALHLELRSPTDGLVLHQWLRASEGRANGSFQLDDTLKTGIYRLRAYTDLNRHDDQPAFERVIFVRNYADKTNPTRSVLADSTVAKTSIISNKIIDNQTIDQKNGLTLLATVSPDSGRVLVDIQALGVGATGAVYVLIQSRNQLVYQAKLRLAGAHGQFSLATALLPSGRAQIMLFDSAGRLRADAFVTVPDPLPPVQLTITPDKARYQPRDRVVLTLNLTDGDGNPVGSSLSASVTDADLVLPDTATADPRAHLLRPTHNRANASSHLGIAPGLDTLGGIVLRGRVLDNFKSSVPDATGVLISNNPAKPAFNAFRTDAQGRFVLRNLTDTVQWLAQVKDGAGKPVKARLMFDPVSLPFPARADLKPAHWPTLAQPLLDAATERQATDVSRYRQKNTRQLAEVIVKAPAPMDDRPDDIRRRSTHNTVSQTVILDQSTASSYANLYVMIAAKIPGISLEFFPEYGGAYSISFNTSSKVGGLQNAQSKGSSSGIVFQNPLFLMDGYPITDPDGIQLLAFNPGDIERVELLKDADAAIYGVRGARGVIAFYSRVIRDSKPGNGRIGTYELYGYPSPRSFPLPNPDGTAPDALTKPDLRDVLYWKPLIQTDITGQASLAFPLSDRAKTIRITVQGITRTGQPVSASRIISVR